MKPTIINNIVKKFSDLYPSIFNWNSLTKRKSKLLTTRDDGQTAILFIFVGGVLLFGIFYILFGNIMGSILDVFQNLISNHSIPISQNQKGSMDNMFRIWWLLPVLCLLVYLIYLIKKGLEKKPEDIYV